MKLTHATATVAALVILAGCATPATVAYAPEPRRVFVEALAPTAPAPTGPVSFAVSGDSISAWVTPFAFNPEQTWVTTTNSEATPLVGGFAENGALLARILEGTAPVEAEVLVVMAGTNDVYYDTPMDQRLATLGAIISTTAADNVLISAVAPIDIAADRGVAWNTVLRQYADDNGHAFFDPWWGMRDTRNYFYPGLSADGVHPLPAMATVVGERMQKHLTHVYRPNSKILG